MSTTTTLFNIPINICRLQEGIALVEELIAAKKPSLVALANAHTLNLAYEHNEYGKVLKNANLVLRDGSGVAWALKKKGVEPLYNFVGTDFIPEFCKSTLNSGYRIFLLGATPGTAQIAGEKLCELAPGIVITGCHHGYIPEDETGQIINYINSTKTDILLVAMGNPKQELWIAENLHRLNVPVSIGVGALFDYLSGSVKRAPQWMIRMGIEWIFRLIIEPKRLCKRYIVGNPKFIIRVYREYFGI
jgi:exopolysaccharide biosynthesis WecB/TagA/CpsF family protein